MHKTLSEIRLDWPLSLDENELLRSGLFKSTMTWDQIKVWAKVMENAATPSATR
jgi:hypothetical protein